jgi:hypothetical protein
MVNKPQPHTEPEVDKPNTGATDPRPIDASNSAPYGAEAKPDSAPDPFDIKRWALSQSFAEVIGVTKVLSHVPLGKPGNQDWVRVHPHPDYRGNFPVIKLKTENEKYFVTPELVAELASEIVPVTIFTVVSSMGVTSLWDVRLPGSDGKDIAWWATERAAAELAMKHWIRIKANKALAANDIDISEKMTTKPRWPDATFSELMMKAFEGRIIDSVDHIVVKRLRGLD